jgi:hypothetical protein
MDNFDQCLSRISCYVVVIAVHVSLSYSNLADSHDVCSTCSATRVVSTGVVCNGHVVCTGHVVCIDHAVCICHAVSTGHVLCTGHVVYTGHAVFNGHFWRIRMMMMSSTVCVVKGRTQVQLTATFTSIEIFPT